MRAREQAVRVAALVALLVALQYSPAAFAAFPSLTTPCSTSSPLLSVGLFAFGRQPARHSSHAFFLTVSFPSPSRRRPAPAWISIPSRSVSRFASLLVLSPPARLSLSDPDAPPAWTLTFSASVRSRPACIALNTSGNLRIVDSANSTLWHSFLHPLDLFLPGHILSACFKLITGSHFPPLINAETVFISYSAIKCPVGLAFFINFSDSTRSFPFRVFRLHDSINHSANCSSSIDIRRHRVSLRLSYDSTQLILHSCIKNVSVRRLIAFGVHSQAVVLLRQGPNSRMRGYKYELSNATSCTAVHDWFANNSSISYDICSVCSAYGICNHLAKNESSHECSCTHLSNNPTSDRQRILPLNKSDSEQGYWEWAHRLINCTCGEAWQLVQLLNCTCGGEASRVVTKVHGADYVANDSLYTEHMFRSTKQVVKYVAYFKVHNISVQNTSAPAGSILKAGSKRDLLITIGSTLAGLLLLGVTIGLMCVCCKRRRKFKALGDEDSTLPAQAQHIVHFTFAQLQQASGDFNCKLGVGGFGSVYKGTLFNGSFVAIKQLENAIRGRKEFELQVAFLHSLNHPNLVRLRGYCSNDSRRLLISEYMPNGSLDAWIFHKPINSLEGKNELSLSPTAFLDWNARFSIALDVAKGLAFLHQSNLIHLDVKPQNILLDDGFAAKLSDYGLSSLMDQDESYLIMHMRGATGYMAPEWLQHAYATEKSDVYSYGMVLMEMLGGRKNVDLSRERESWYFPLVAAKMYKEGKVLEVLDEKLTKSSINAMGEAQCEQAKRLMQIAFWCILENPTKRPDVGSLLLMLEGHQDVPEPPLPSCFGGLNVHASISNHDDNQHFHHDYYNRSGSSSPSCFNISFAPEPPSAMKAYNSWSHGGGQHNDCSLLLPS